MPRKFVTNPIYKEYQRLWHEVNKIMVWLKEHSDSEVNEKAMDLEKKLMKIDLFLKTITESFWLEAPFNEVWVEPKGWKAPFVKECRDTNSVAP